jgi:hypothetical protein
VNKRVLWLNVLRASHGSTYLPFIILAWLALPCLGLPFHAFAFALTAVQPFCAMQIHGSSSPAMSLNYLLLLACLHVLQVHDELLFEVAQPHLQQVAALVRGVMEGASDVWGLSVALPVKLAAGPSWGQLQDLREEPAAAGSTLGNVAGAAAGGAAAAAAN